MTARPPNVSPADELVEFPPARDPRLPAIYIMKNHPFKIDSGTAYYFIHDGSPKASQEVYRMEVEDLKIPQGSGDEAKSLGFLELKPGDIIFSRLKSAPSSGLEDVPVMWVTGIDDVPLKLQIEALSARDTALGDRHLRSREHAQPDKQGVVAGGTAWERSFKGKYYDKERGRCYAFGCTYQKQKTLYSPCAAGKATIADEATLKMRSDLCNAATEIAMLSLKQGPAHVLDAIRLNHDLFNTPRLGSGTNFAFTSNQLNLAHIREWNSSETLADSMGIKFGGAHIDRLDSPGHYTNIISLSDLPEGCDPGRFFIVYPGVFCTLHNFVSVNFSGLRVHGGSPPIGPKNTVINAETGEDPMKWGIRCMVVSYAKTAPVSAERKMPLMQIEHDKILSITPEMLRPGEFNVQRKFDSTNFVTEGPTIMSPSALMTFMSRCFLLIVLAMVSKLPSTLEVAVDSDAFLKSFSYMDLDGSRRSVSSWVDGPGWRRPDSIGGTDTVDDLTENPPSLVSQREHLDTKRKLWTEHVNRCAGHIPSAVSCLSYVTPLEGWVAGQSLIKIKRISFNKEKKGKKTKKIPVVDDDEESSSDDDEDPDAGSLRLPVTVRNAGKKSKDKELLAAAPVNPPSASRAKLRPVVLIERSSDNWPYKSVAHADDKGCSRDCATDSLSGQNGEGEGDVTSATRPSSIRTRALHGHESVQVGLPSVTVEASSISGLGSMDVGVEPSLSNDDESDDRSLNDDREEGDLQNSGGYDRHSWFGSSEDGEDSGRTEEDDEEEPVVGGGVASSGQDITVIPGKRPRVDTPDSDPDSNDDPSHEHSEVGRLAKRRYTGFDNIWTSDGYAKLEVHLTDCGPSAAGHSDVLGGSGDKSMSFPAPQSVLSSIDNQEESARLRELPKSLHGITAEAVHFEVQQLHHDIVELAGFTCIFDIAQTVEALINFHHVVNCNPMENRSVSYVQAAWSGIEVLARYEKINSIRLRKLRSCIMLSSAASWRWLTIVVPDAIKCAMNNNADQTHWLFRLLRTIHEAVRMNSERYTFSPVHFGLNLEQVRPAVIDLDIYCVPAPLDHGAWLGLYISVTRDILKIWLNFPTGDAVWKGLFALNIIQWIGPEFLMLNLVWDRFRQADQHLVRFSKLPDNLDVSRYPVLCPTSALRRDVLRLAQLTDDYITGKLYRYVEFDAQSRSYINYMSEGLRQLSEEHILYFKRFMLGCFKHLFRGEAADNKKLGTRLQDNPDKYSPFRELAPTRLNMVRSDGPFSDRYLRTVLGLFGALVNRGVSFGTAFSRTGRTVFSSPQDFLSAVEQCPYSSIHDSKSYCDPGAYGRPNPKRHPGLVDVYWQKIQEIKWDGLDSKVPVAFTDAYKFFFPSSGARPFPELGPLGAYLITVDYAYSGIVATPSFNDIGRMIYNLDKGPARALQFLGLVSVETSKPKTSGARDARVVDFVKAFTIADKIVRDSIPMEYHSEVGMDIFVIEHSLCKFMRAHKLCDLSL